MSASPVLPAPPTPLPPASSRRLGVVMLLGWNGLGGTQRQALRLSAALRGLGARPVVVTMRRPGLTRHDTIYGVTVHRLGRSPVARCRWLTFLAGFLVWMVRHRRTYDVIHAHNLPAALTAALLRPLLGKPIVVKLPNAIGVEAYRRRRFGIVRWAVLRRHIARFVAVNGEIERRLCEQGIPAQRIVRIPNGVESATRRRRPDTVAERSALGLPSDARIVVYLGRLVPDKGVAWLLDVWKAVAAAEPAGHLLVVGEGPAGNDLRQLAERDGIADRVSFLGFRDDVDRLLALADILVLPSRSEGMSNALLEGMAHGLAIVATAVPGNEAVIEDGKDGLLVAYGDCATLRQALVDLLRDADLRSRLGGAAAAKSRATFSIDGVARAYQELYRGLVTVPGREASA